MTAQHEHRQLRRFGRRLAGVRKSQGLTQEQLAERLDISHICIAYIETGKRWPRFSTLLKIASCLNITISELFEGL